MKSALGTSDKCQLSFQHPLQSLSSQLRRRLKARMIALRCHGKRHSMDIYGCRQQTANTHGNRVCFIRGATISVSDKEKEKNIKVKKRGRCMRPTLQW